ncbi:MAG: hypothetical protein ACRC5M_04610 [Anaeroplasmataceae bacterium]
MYKTNKTPLSSILYQDFGVEDFESGRMIGQESLSGVSVANQLGLLSPLNDRHNTDPACFAAESATLLGEAIGMTKFASGQIQSLNDRFAIAADIKRRYGVEGFDPFTFGCEGFIEGIKTAFKAVVAAIKKVIQSISNWIKSVMNWAGSQFALGQQRLIDDHAEDENKFSSSVTVKAMVPGGEVTGGRMFIAPISVETIKIGKAISAFNSLVTISNVVTNESKRTITEDSFNKDIDGSIANKLEELNVTFKDLHGKKIPVAKLGSATKISNCTVFGHDNPKKVTVSALSYITLCNWKTLLSEKDLKSTEELVKDGKVLIKVMNETLKKADGLSKELTIKEVKTMGTKTKLTTEEKEYNKRIKNIREAINKLNNANRFGSLMTGILHGVFGNYLKLRSYTATAVRALVKDMNKNDDDVDEESEAGRRKKANKIINHR